MTPNPVPPPLTDYDPSVPAVELVCDRLADLGLAVGADTARSLLREVIALEAARLDARLLEGLETSLETVRVATQSALALLRAHAGDGSGQSDASLAHRTATLGAGSTVPRVPAAPTEPARVQRPAPEPVPEPAPVARTRPVVEPAPPPQPAPAQREPEPPARTERPPRPDFEEEIERRPVFKRPRGR
ncbi:MAG: hypothetical protein H0W67_04330 [Gemmatimonadales bacterium]|nr:hypothetical protein [Gemmatimonadales bacterium]